jgi:predicted GIY-YIG superfamily endonuclease
VTDALAHLPKLSLAPVGVVYLLHFSRPVGSGATHYLGWSGDPKKRYEDHVSGKGAKLLRVASRAGVEVSIVRTWEGMTRYDERRMKSHGNLHLLCPACGEAARVRRNEAQRARRARDGRADRPRGAPRGSKSP